MSSPSEGILSFCSLQSGIFRDEECSVSSVDTDTKQGIYYNYSSGTTFSSVRPILLRPIFAEPLLLREETLSPVNRAKKGGCLGDRSPKTFKSSVVLSVIYAEPLFTGIEYGKPASEDYMMVKPLFA